MSISAAAGDNATKRDAGLVRGLGIWGLAASIVSMVVGAGIFAVPSALAAAVGPYAPLAFLACGVAIGAVAICFAEGGSRLPTSGGAYGYIEASMGPLAGYVCGTILWVSDALASGEVAEPARTIPRSVAVALIFVTVLYTSYRFASHTRQHHDHTLRDLPRDPLPGRFL